MRVSVSVSGSCNQSHTFNRTNLLPYNISLHVISFWHCKFTHLGEIEGISLNISASFSMFTYMFIRQSYSDDRLLKVWVFTNSTLTSCNYIQTQVNRSNIRRFLQIQMHYRMFKYLACIALYFSYACQAHFGCFTVDSSSC